MDPPIPAIAIDTVPLAVLIDLDDTLVVNKASTDAALMEVCRQAQAHIGIEPARLAATVREKARVNWYALPTIDYCLNIGISSAEGLWADYDTSDDQIRLLGTLIPTYRFQTWHESIGSFGVPDAGFALELSENLARLRRSRQTAFPDALRFLQKVRKGLRVAVVTNGNPTVQRFKVRATGLDRFLDAVVISGEIGVGKPGLAIFQHACELLGVSPADTVMIGDSLNTDVRGAQAAGMRSVWLNRGGSQRRSPDRHPRPDLEIAGLDDLFRSR